jgi:hypothetical protein
MASKDYKYFTGNNYDVNIIGIRNTETKGKVTNAFDDTLLFHTKMKRVSGNIMNLIVLQTQEHIGLKM